MQDCDLVSNEYFQDDERFADLMNAVNFNGKPVIRPGHLSSLDSHVTTVSSHLNKKVLKNRNVRNLFWQSKYRDVIKKTAFGTNFVLMGVENQSRIHYAMPLRCMNYDMIGYEEQLRRIRKKHEQAKDLPKSEYLSRFAKDDLLKPVITWAVYWGKEPWDGSYDLHGLLDFSNIPEELRDKISNYQMNILDVRNYEHLDYFKTDIQQVFGFIQRSDDKKELAEYVNHHANVFSNLPEDAYNLITVMTHTEKLEQLRETVRNEGGDVNVCKAIQDMIEDGKIEIMVKNIAAIRKKYNKHLSTSEAAEALEWEEAEISQVYELITHNPEFTDAQIAEVVLKDS